jgi:hypothetical protein
VSSSWREEIHTCHCRTILTFPVTMDWGLPISPFFPPPPHRIKWIFQNTPLKGKVYHVIMVGYDHQVNNTST